MLGLAEIFLLMVTSRYLKISSSLAPPLNPLIKHIYPGISSNPHPPPTYFIHCMILAPRNEYVHVVNRNIIDVFQASAANTKVYQSADSAIIREQESDEIPVEFLNAINVSGLPVSKLTLKVGCPVMLLRNLSVTCHDNCMHMITQQAAPVQSWS